jgi:DNA segregation ATPase FtsK/SpoIIIE, S-DNA-T family
MSETTLMLKARTQTNGRQTQRPWLAEFLGLLSFGFALMLLISLATYDPRDPAYFFKTGDSGAARNFIGPAGAFVAELLIPQLFGVAAMLLPMVLGITGWKLFWCRPIEAPYTKAVGLSLLLASLTAFFALSFDTVTIEGEAVRAGGATGTLLAGLLTRSFHRTGAFIVVATTLFVSLILATQFSFASLLRSVWGVVLGRGRALRTSWAHFRETRRKESMRREVIRKHAQKERAKTDETDEPGVPRIRKVAAAQPEAEEQREPDSPALVDLPLQLAPAAPVQRRLEFSSTEEPEAESVPEPQPRRKVPPKPQPSATRGGFTLPPTSILDAVKPPPGGEHQSRLFERGKALEAKCHEFGVMGVIKETQPGPIVTTYEFKPDPGIKYSKVVGLADDLALALEAESIRIDRISGKGTVGIEIPNQVRETISLREILESETFRSAPGRLVLALGKVVSGETYVTDLTAMPHLLIAGATGTGKSVGLNCVITSLLYKNTPDECRLILIDPKRLELGVYEDIPHLLTPVVTDPKVAANVLRWAVQEMEKRIRTLASEGVRNIEQFNNIVRAERAAGNGQGEEVPPLHYIVIIIDELADLMMVSSNEVEEAITRLAQMARAVGIHLILATQRPSVDVLTGLIKANFPSRISYRVSARVDSRTILDSIGAEQLLGRGDMLFLPPGSARLIRIHGAYVSEHEVSRLASFLRKTAKPRYDENVGRQEKTSSEIAADERDELFDEAVRFVVQSGQASTSMLQRRFRVGFSRAGRLIDMMERDGIIGPADGSKAREILVAPDFYETVDSWPK